MDDEALGSAFLLPNYREKLIPCSTGGSGVKKAGEGRLSGRRRPESAGRGESRAACLANQVCKSHQGCLSEWASISDASAASLIIRNP